MNAHTPSISVIDPRGLAVRALAYHRLAPTEQVLARVTHQVFDPLGRLVQQRDPRLFALSQNDASVPANLTSFYSLTGQALCSNSVDAGWQLGLAGAAGQALESWDQRGWHRRTEHDPLLRPVAVHEQAEGEPERCVERITFGGASGDHAKHNRCGQPIRQDDPAGTRLLSDYGMSAAILGDVRHFLNDLNPVDWPVVEADRDPLLEPGNGARTWWTYAPSGELITQTDTKGHRQHFAHDQAGQLHSVGLQRAGQQDVDTLVSSLHYSALGLVEHELAGNGMRTTSVYDPANGHLMLLTTQGPDQRFLQKLSYGYDPTGNIIEIADAALPIQHFANQRIEPVRRFIYDTLYQLISATGWESAKPSLGPALPEWQAFGPPDGSRWCNYSETYQYDEAGNLLQRIHHGAVGDTLTMRVAPLSNRSVKVHPTQFAIDESFDARGNLLELQPGQGLQWNGRNQLAQITQVHRPDGADDLERYAYDSEGTRLRKIRTSAAKFVTHTAEVRYLPGLELHSNSATGEQLQVVSVQAGRCTVRLLHWDSPPPAELENDQLRYCFDDHLGSSAFEVDAKAQVISQEVYYPFGGTAWLAGRNEVETGYKTIRYSGKERDATGLYYYGARYYAPWLQRWLNPDPVGDVEGVNFYRFVRNSPVSFKDRHGHLSISAIAKGYPLEREGGLHQHVVLRGMDNIRRNLPAAYVDINNALSELHKTVSFAVQEMEGGRVNTKSSVVKKFFGSISLSDMNYLVAGTKAMLSELEDVQRNQERIVAIAGLERNKNTVAKVMFRSQDGGNKIYINTAILGSDDFSTGSLFSHVLGHELTHLLSVFSSKDFYYLDPRFSSVGNIDKNKKQEAFNRYVAPFVQRVSDEVRLDRFSAAPVEFVRMAGFEGLSFEYALAASFRKFMHKEDFRARVALKTADMITAFIFEVGSLAKARAGL